MGGPSIGRRPSSEHSDAFYRWRLPGSDSSGSRSTAPIRHGTTRSRARWWCAYRAIAERGDAEAAYSILRGMKTLALRMARHNTNAMAIAEHLAGHQKI